MTRSSSLLAALASLLAPPGQAATVGGTGGGTAVSVVDYAATFDSLTSTNTLHLDTYAEGALRITTSGNNWGADVNMSLSLDPFHMPGGTFGGFFAISAGNNDWVTIELTNHALLHGVEFIYGNTWTTGGQGGYTWGAQNAAIDWQTWTDNTMNSSGTFAPYTVPLATILAFYDPAGFDRLLVRCTSPGSGDPTLQALALDNVNVMATNVPPAPLIYASDLAINQGTGVASLTVTETIAGCQYRMVYTESLGPGDIWAPVVPPSPEGWQAGGGLLTFSDAGAAGRPHRFYRIEVR